jgi:hypothetical protein
MPFFVGHCRRVRASKCSERGDIRTASESVSGECGRALSDLTGAEAGERTVNPCSVSKRERRDEVFHKRE